MSWNLRAKAIGYIIFRHFSVCVCVCAEFLFLRKLPTKTVLCIRESRGQWPPQESTANEATLELGGYPG